MPITVTTGGIALRNAYRHCIRRDKPDARAKVTNSEPSMSSIADRAFFSTNGM